MLGKLIKAAGPRVFGGRCGAIMVCNRQFATSALPRMARSPIGRLAASPSGTATAGNGATIVGRMVAGLGTMVAIGNTLSNAATVVDHVVDYTEGNITGYQAAFGVGGACMGIAGSWTRSTMYGFAYAAGALNCFVFRHGLGGQSLSSPAMQTAAAIDVSNAFFGVLVSGTSGLPQLAGTAVGAAINANYSSTVGRVGARLTEFGAELVVSGQCTLTEAGDHLSAFALRAVPDLETLEAYMAMPD